MAINLLSGKMLEADLLRDNVNLSVESDLLFFDIANNRIGINNAVPTTDLDVTGDIKSTTASIGEVDIATNEITTSAGELALTSFNHFVTMHGIFTFDSAGGITSATEMALTTTGDGDLIVTAGAGLINFVSSSALQLPSGTALEQPTGVAGMIRWNEDTLQIEYYDGSVWGSAQDAFVPSSEQFTPGAGQSAFVLNKAATVDSILVVINGLVQDPADAYTVVATLLTVSTPLTVTDIVSVRYLAP